MDFEEYLQQRLLEIEDLKDRVIMRKIFESVLIPLNEYCDEKYKRMTEKVLGEPEACESFAVCTGLAERKKYDVTIGDMLPMNKDDLLEKKVELTYLTKRLSEGNEVKLFTVFLKADYDLIKELSQSKREFHGLIHTEGGEFPARFVLRQNQEYLKMVRDLYPVFLQNEVPWRTICAPYLYKFFDVFLCGSDELSGEEITEIDVDFEEYRELVAYDLIPLWNLELVHQNTSGYAKPCIDQIHYEHQIYKERLGEGHFLIMNQDVKILSRHMDEGDLLITCDVRDPVDWKLLQVHPVTNTRYLYPVMSNKMAGEPARVIRTKAAIEKMIRSLGYEYMLEFADMEFVREDVMTFPDYHVDEIWIEEHLLRFIPGEPRNILRLSFRRMDEKAFYAGDIMNYIVTRLQWSYPEYLCTGKMI